MKKVMLIGLLFVANIAGASCVGPYCWDDTGASIAGVSITGGSLVTKTSTPYAITVSSTTAAIPTGTPPAAHILAVDNSHVLYISTGTGAGAWVKVGGQ